MNSEINKLHISSENGNAEILVGEHLDLKSYLKEYKRIIVLTDKTVDGLYGFVFKDYPKIFVNQGEEHKNLQTVNNVYSELLKMNADRQTLLVAFGGGIVCDIAGFAASTYLRGIDFGFFPSTVLSQADAGVGGKTGVNFEGRKNMIGSFSQAKFVVCDVQFLKSLSYRQFTNGLSEIIKAALIADDDMFKLIENRKTAIKQRNSEEIKYLINKSLKIKTDIVNQDEKEKDLRRILNFGHSFGHAIELKSELLHGEAVAAGMVLAAKISEKSGLLHKEDVDRIVRILKYFELPAFYDFDFESVFHHLGSDKKMINDRLQFILLDRIGKARVQAFKIDELKELIS